MKPSSRVGRDWPAQPTLNAVWSAWARNAVWRDAREASLRASLHASLTSSLKASLTDSLGIWLLSALTVIELTVGVPLQAQLRRSLGATLGTSLDAALDAAKQPAAREGGGRAGPSPPLQDLGPELLTLIMDRAPSGQ